jgi:hypothetical protein
MKVWSSVEMYGGVIQGMEVLPSFEAARKHFKNFIDANGTIDDCDPDAYMDGSTEGAEEFFYWNDGPDADAEITIWPVDFEMKVEG